MSEKIEDLNLPNAVVTRIIKEAVPKGTIISKVLFYQIFTLNVKYSLLPKKSTVYFYSSFLKGSYYLIHNFKFRPISVSYYNLSEYSQLKRYIQKFKNSFLKMYSYLTTLGVSIK